MIYLYFAFATLFTAVITLTLDKAVYMQNFAVINQLQAAVLLVSTIFFCNKLWPLDFREKYIGLIWHIAIFVSLSFVSSFLVLISNFSQISLIVLILNLTVIGMLLNWQSALAMSILGALASYFLYKWSVGDDLNLSSELNDLKLKISYVLLMVGSFTLAFLKPRQEYQELTEEKNGHLNGRISSQEKQLREALALRSEFIRNVQHEYHAPITGITGFAQTLDEAYDKLTEEQRKESIKNILICSRRLDAFDSNISSLSALSKAGYELQLEKINLSDLLRTQLALCRKLYEENKEAREFEIDIEDDIVVKGDRKYLIQLLDNLIINAITYCKTGKITVELERFESFMYLNILDEGIGIPFEELKDIFEEFIVSSKTRTPAGNRGVGLALCKCVVEVHGGRIEAESDGEKGAIFKITLPLS